MDRSQELCRVKKAVRSLLKQNPDGMTCSEIRSRLQRDAIFMGTHRNLLSQTASIIRLLLEEGSISCRGEGVARIFLYAG
ncbi:MAG: hypothetical protein PHN75_20515 [Syntrophales bacterium]|nr:hypothetical protein [Syntrophales bacterium]